MSKEQKIKILEDARDSVGYQKGGVKAAVNEAGRQINLCGKAYASASSKFMDGVSEEFVWSLGDLRRNIDKKIGDWQYSRHLKAQARKEKLSDASVSVKTRVETAGYKLSCFKSDISGKVSGFITSARQGISSAASRARNALGNKKTAFDNYVQGKKADLDYAVYNLPVKVRAKRDDLEWAIHNGKEKLSDASVSAKTRVETAGYKLSCLKSDISGKVSGFITSARQGISSAVSKARDDISRRFGETSQRLDKEVVKPAVVKFENGKLALRNGCEKVSSSASKFGTAVKSGYDDIRYVAMPIFGNALASWRNYKAQKGIYNETMKAGSYDIGDIDPFGCYAKSLAAESEGLRQELGTNLVKHAELQGIRKRRKLIRQYGLNDRVA